MLPLLCDPRHQAYARSRGEDPMQLIQDYARMIDQAISERHLVERGLVNYWGYNSIGFFAPDNRFSYGAAPGDQVAEFKNMVRTLHAAGIEVILDVVYNHTAEGNHLGPTICFRGVDNSAYYRLVEDQPRYHMDYTG